MLNRQLPLLHCSAEIIANLRAAHAADSTSRMGIDVVRGEAGDMSELGIFEAYRVKSQVRFGASGRGPGKGFDGFDCHFGVWDLFAKHGRVGHYTHKQATTPKSRPLHPHMSMGHCCGLYEMCKLCLHPQPACQHSRTCTYFAGFGVSYRGR